jgi:hypothetical protein
MNSQSEVKLHIPTTFTLDYAKWICGSPLSHKLNEETTAGRGATSLLNEEGYMCCLGQFSAQCGMPEPLLLNVGMPTALTEMRAQTPSTFFLHSISRACQFSNINDSHITSITEKVRRIGEELAKHGYKLTIKNFPQNIVEELKSMQAIGEQISVETSVESSVVAAVAANRKFRGVFTLDVARWNCGIPKNNDEPKNCHGAGRTKLLNAEGFSDAVGLFCAQLGATEAELRDQMYPSKLSGDKYSAFRTPTGGITKLTEKINTINDDKGTTVAEKIGKLRGVLSKWKYLLLVENVPADVAAELDPSIIVIDKTPEPPATIKETRTSDYEVHAAAYVVNGEYRVVGLDFEAVGKGNRLDDAVDNYRCHVSQVLSDAATSTADLSSHVSSADKSADYLFSLTMPVSYTYEVDVPNPNA